MSVPMGQLHQGADRAEGRTGFGTDPKAEEIRKRTKVPLRRSMLRRLHVLSRIQDREMCFHFTEVTEVKCV